MGRTYFGDDKKIKAYLGSKKVKSMWYGSIRVYPNAGEVTYYVDNGVVYTEEIDIDQSCLTPTTFTPSKSGWTFVGWREDSTASSSVLSEKISDGNNYTLYAVFRQNVTVTKYNGSSSATTETKIRYYNNTNVANPSFTLSQNNLSGWTAQGWCTSNSATAAVAVNNGATITLTANATYYGKYSQTITLTYNGNGATGGSTAAQTGTRYYNSGNYNNPSFSLRSCGFSRTNYSFVNWRMGSTSGTAYNAGASVTLSSNTVFYASWKLSSIAIPSQIGNDGWQGAAYTGYSKTGPYDLTGITSLTFTVYAKTRESLTTGVTVGVSSNGSSFTRSQYYGVHRDNPNCESGWGGYFERFTVTVNVSGLTGKYYILHAAAISSYNWSRIESISVR